MASKLARITGTDEDCRMDASSMIDMVFQLLLFFMVSSTLITNRIDPNVQIPVAPNAKPPELAAGRIVINIYDDGSFAGGRGKEEEPLADMDAITQYVQKYKEGIAPGVTPKIQLRGHRTALVKYSKQVVQAAGAAGVNTIVFSAYTTGKFYKD